MQRILHRLILPGFALGLFLLPVRSEEDHDHDHGSGKIELETLHADVEVAYEDGGLELHIHDESTDTELEPGSVILPVPELAESAVPENADFAFLGNAGDPLWILPQVAQSNVLFLGVAAGEVENGVLMNDTAYVELVSVDGPGQFFVYDTDAFGKPNVMINSADGISGDDRLTVLAGSHFHVDWTFTAEGDYEITFVIHATLADGTPIESEPAMLFFEVGHHEEEDDGHGHDHGHGDDLIELETGHADVEVAYEDGELELHIHDETTDTELEPGNVILHVPEIAETSVPEGASFAFLGHAGDPLWILPQVAQADVLFLGVAAGEVEDGVLMNDTAYVELVSVDGPGNFFVYDTDAFGVPNVMINSADGITSDDRLTVLAGSHFHVDWTFDVEGDYEITFVIHAALADGTPIESEPATLAFEVGHHGEASLAFTFDTFEVPDATATTISDIQNDGTLVGRYLDAAGLSQGFIQRGEELTTFNITGTTNTFPGGMNSQGQVVGFYRDAADPEIQYGFIREADGSVTSIEPEGQTFTYAWRINDSGQVNGYWFENDPFFIRSFQRAADGSMQDFAFEGSPTGTVTRGLNDAGVQAGWKWTEDFSLQGITWEDGAFSEPYVVDGWAHTLPGDINNNGEMAGTVNDSNFERNAGFFRDADGEITVFNPPGATSVEIFGLNDEGDIVGEYADASGKRRGFIAHPAAAIAEGHADVGLAYEDGELELHIHDEEADVERPPGEVAILLNEDAEQAIPDTLDFSFLGDPDYSVWVLPQSFDEHLPFLGLSAEEVPEGIFVDDLVSLELVSVDALGDFFAYRSDGFGNITVMMDSANGIQAEQDRISAASGSHQHLNWAFNASGTYRIGFRVTGSLQAGGEIAGETMFVTFVVPEAERPQPAPDPGDDDFVRLTQGEVDLGVAFEDGAFDLHLHDHAADIEYESGDARLHVAALAKSTVPDDPNFSFLGTPDNAVWILPQRENPKLLFLGLAGEEIEAGVFQDERVELSIVSLVGPGDLFLYGVDGFGAADVHFNSQDGLTESDRYEVAVGSHAHVNWAFTEPGLYELTLQASGTLAEGGLVQSEPTTFIFEVEPIELHIDVVQDDHGHIEVLFATQDGIVYQMETSTDLQTWENEGQAFIGTGRDKTLELPSDSQGLYTRLKIVDND